MKMKRGRHIRPNVISAKASGAEELDSYINSRQSSFGKGFWRGNFRAYIQDLCDFCLEYRYILRRLMTLRKRGYRFGCYKCLEEGKFKFKNNEKVLMAFLSPGIFAPYSKLNRKKIENE